jgi:hypothetical protein
MPIRGVIVKRIPIPDVKGVSNYAKRNAAKEVAAELEGWIQGHCSRPAPPASKPGQYPRARSYEFVTGVNVTGTEKYLTVASQAMHGVYMEDPDGTRPNGRRRWATKAVKAKDWVAKIKRLARGE